MELTGYLDFWFREVPIIERIARFHGLGIRRLDVARLEGTVVEAPRFLRPRASDEGPGR